MESGNFLVGKNGILPSLLPIHMKRRRFFRKRRTNYKAIQVEDPYKKLEVLLSMTEEKLNSLRMSIEKNQSKKIKIQREIPRRRQQQQQQQQHHIEVERNPPQQQQQQQQQEVVVQQRDRNEAHRRNNNNEVQDVWSWEGPPPEWIVKRVENHEAENLKYLFKKVLTASDVEGQQNRLLPTRKDMRQVVLPYLTAEERNRLEAEHSVNVTVIDEHGTEYKKMMMRFYRSLMAHRIIGSDWSNFVRNNGLESGRHVVYVWGLRVGGELWLAFDYAAIDR